MTALPLAAARPWAPHPRTAPHTESLGDRGYLAAANGTRTCAGGWQFEYDGIVPGHLYRVALEVACDGVTVPRDTLLCTAHWARLPTDAYRHAFQAWEYLLPQRQGEGRLSFGRLAQAPADATGLTVRCTFRWSAVGRSVWQTPVVGDEGPAPATPRPLRVAVVTGRCGSRPSPSREARANVAYYAGLCESACRAAPTDLVALPEIAVQWGLPGHAVDVAVPVPGPETEPFADLARRYATHLVLPLYERDGDAVYNTALLFGPRGDLLGRYRKVHLAVGGEAESGLLPGDGFPVIPTAVGRLGCNICMDSSAAESARMVGLNGADVLVLPIMGDHRADRWTAGSPIYSESRWLAIMRTRAMDNQLAMVVARNTTQGSCIIDRKGDVLAWNEGDRDAIRAELDLASPFRVWQGSCFRDVNWLQRRPHLYGAFVDPDNLGSLTEAATPPP